MFLDISCDKCKVANYCPKVGRSPIYLPKKRIYCKLVGNYAKTPVDPEILSEESRILYEKNGPCITFVEIPEKDESGIITYKTEKIFSPPVLSPHDKTNLMQDMLYPKSYNDGRKGL